jgi:hypothetical protein
MLSGTVIVACYLPAAESPARIAGHNPLPDELIRQKMFTIAA